MPRTDDQSPGRLGPPRAVAHGGLAPRGLWRHPGRGLAFATAVRMVARVHDDSADLRALAQVPGTAGLAEILVLVVEVADLADGGHAPHLARRHADRGVVASLASNCAEVPAERTIWPPLPGVSSMLWMVVPSGMFASGRALPTRASASAPETTTSPTFRPWGSSM